jgi:hypothetical protein
LKDSGEFADKEEVIFLFLTRPLPAMKWLPKMRLSISIVLLHCQQKLCESGLAQILAAAKKLRKQGVSCALAPCARSSLPPS